MSAKKNLLKFKKARQRLVVLEEPKIVSISGCVSADGKWRVEGGCWKGSVTVYELQFTVLYR
jgi:hypothetical protein